MSERLANHLEMENFQNEAALAVIKQVAFGSDGLRERLGQLSVGNGGYSPEQLDLNEGSPFFITPQGIRFLEAQQGTNGSGSCDQREEMALMNAAILSFIGEFSRNGGGEEFVEKALAVGDDLSLKDLLLASREAVLVDLSTTKLIKGWRLEGRGLIDLLRELGIEREGRRVDGGGFAKMIPAGCLSELAEIFWDILGPREELCPYVCLERALGFYGKLRHLKTIDEMAALYDCPSAVVSDALRRRGSRRLMRLSRELGAPFVRVVPLDLEAEIGKGNVLLEDEAEIAVDLKKVASMSREKLGNHCLAMAARVRGEDGPRQKGKGWFSHWEELALGRLLALGREAGKKHWGEDFNWRQMGQVTDEIGAAGSLENFLAISEKEISAEEAEELADIFWGTSACRLLVEACVGLVIKRALAYRASWAESDLNLDDLTQAGNEGLIIFLQKHYDWEKGYDVGRGGNYWISNKIWGQIRGEDFPRETGFRGRPERTHRQGLDKIVIAREERAERERLFYQALSLLTIRQRKVLELRYRLTSKGEELAQELNLRETDLVPWKRLERVFGLTGSRLRMIQADAIRSLRKNLGDEFEEFLDWS